MQVADAVKVDGLDELIKGARALPRAAERSLRTLRGDASDLVVDRTRRRMPKRTGQARRSVRRRDRGSVTEVVEGGPRAEYVPWLDFGGRTGRRHAVVRPFLANGRYLYREVVQLRRSRLDRMIGDALDDALDDAGVS